MSIRSGTCVYCLEDLPTAAAGGVAACPSCGHEAASDLGGAGDPEDARIAAAIEEFERLRREGVAADPASFSAHHPEIASELEELLRLLVQLEGVEQGPAGRPSGSVPARLGRYAPLEELGRGGAAHVFRARDPELERDVALKVLYLDPLRGPERRVRFLREARALAQLNHPNVVPVHDVGTSGPWCWIAMELMPRSLADPSPTESTDERDRVRRLVMAVAAAADGIAHAHSKGVLHRDVKPANLLVDSRGDVRVGDFGLAWISGDASLTRSGVGLGTPGYAAPEQLAGAAADARSDVYGLGATLHALVTGAQPSRANPAEPRDLRGLPSGLAAIVAQSLSTDAAERQASVKELADELRAWLSGSHPRAPRLPIARRALPWLAGALSLAVAWFGIGRGEPLPGGYVLEYGEGPADGLSDSVSRWYRGEYQEHPEPRDAVAFEAASGRYQAEIRRGWRPAIRLLRGDDAVARFPLDEQRFADLDRWSFRHSPVDVDGDGFPEVILHSERTLAVIRWDPAAWGGAAGWRVRLDGWFAEGSPALGDWDGDGVDELLIATSGHAAAGEAAVLHALDPLAGTVEAAVPFATRCTSTPQFLRDAAGRVEATYLDSAGAETDEWQPPRLWRFPAGSPSRASHRDFPDAHRLTWPAFTDVTGDGRAEVLIGATHRGTAGQARSERPTTLHCLRADLGGEPLWTYSAGRGQFSYLLLSDQDGDGFEDACFCTWASCVAVNARAGIGDGERVIWRVALGADERVAHQPVEIGDWTGDGIPEIAVGTTAARIVVLSAESSEPSWSLDMPVSQTFGGGILARLVVIEDAGGPALVATTADGWIVAHRLPPSGSEPSWAGRFATKGSVASPVGVARDATDAATRWAVLATASDVATGCAKLTLYGPPERGPTPSRLWSTSAEAWVMGTPVVARTAGRHWAYFADTRGHVHGVPVPFD